MHANLPSDSSVRLNYIKRPCGPARWAKAALWPLLWLICFGPLGAWAADFEASAVHDPPPPFTPNPNDQYVLTTTTAVSAGSAWLNLPPVDYVPPPYARYMRGLRICLDPGHGGDQHLKNYKAGASGYREAIMNLAVANELKNFLLKSGVTVVMTRDGDWDLKKNGSEALAARPKVAELNQCDLFISMHHNAHSRKTANYSSAFYHADPGYLYSNIDLGRDIVNELEYWLRLPEYANDGLYSDYLMFDNAGFGVLRGAKVPAILIEASFFSCPEEEARLKTPEYLKREAWAYYMGIAKYARDGMPRAEMTAPANGILTGQNPLVQFRLADGCPEGWGAKATPRIIRHSIQLLMDNMPVPFEYDDKTGLLTYRYPQPLAPRTHEFLVRYINMRKNSNLPKIFQVAVRP